jgi:hypothetical protein
MTKTKITTYTVVAYRDDYRWIEGKFIETLADAEALQARLYAANPGTDYYIE